MSNDRVLTPYDEFPVHTTPHPVSYIPSTDYNWDEGYYFGLINPDEQIQVSIGFRINPNTDMIGGYALVNVAGIQRTFRFSRCWRQNYKLEVGPFRYDVIEAFKKLHLVLDDNDSGIAFDVLWLGAAPAHLEGHHTAEVRGRRTTDQSRYTQPGTAEGTLRLGDRSWDVGAKGWIAVRDHSWGLYVERPPFAADPKWLPPRPVNANGRALRFWVVFKSEGISGFYHMHEDAEGVQRKLDDVFGTPFGGTIYRGWDGEPVELASARHDIIFQPGTRMMKSAVVHMTDIDGGQWRQEIEAASPPWVIQTMGYTPGAWKDGGTFHSYHGSQTLATEWDEFDFSVQPFEYSPYGEDGKSQPDTMRTGLSYKDKIHGVEYVLRIKTFAPDGSVTEGAGQLELFINGPYKPYGFE